MRAFILQKVQASVVERQKKFSYPSINCRKEDTHIIIFSAWDRCEQYHHKKGLLTERKKKSKNYQAYRIVYLELLTITIIANISEKFITNIPGLAVFQHAIDLGNIHILVLVRMPCSLKCLNCLVWIWGDAIRNQVFPIP